MNAQPCSVTNTGKRTKNTGITMNLATYMLSLNTTILITTIIIIITDSLKQLLREEEWLMLESMMSSSVKSTIHLR